MSFKPIETPRGSIVQGPNGQVEIVWKSGCAPRITEVLGKKQEIIDSEVLRLCAPMVPKDTGALELSGILGTIIGSGEVRYVAPYARAQYYNTAQTRGYDSKRGGKWFERMKVAHKAQIERLING